MDELQARLAAELAKLRDSYLERVPAELDVLSQLVQKMAGTPERALLEELHLRLHKVAGSAGTFGLTKMSECARQLENVARDWLEEGLVNINDDTLKQWAEGVTRLSDTIAR